MEYNDNQISSPAQFENLAKEYSQMLQKKHAVLSQGKEIVSLLNFLSWLYDFIRKNIKSQKLKLFLQKAIHQNALDISDIHFLFNLNQTESQFQKPKQINSFSQCLSLAIKTETQLVKTLLNETSYNLGSVIFEIAQLHLENIKELSSYIY